MPVFRPKTPYRHRWRLAWMILTGRLTINKDELHNGFSTLPSGYLELCWRVSAD